MVRTAALVLAALSAAASLVDAAPAEGNAMPLQKQARDTPSPALAAREPQVSTVTFGGFEFPGAVVTGQAFTLAPTEGVSIPPITMADVTIPGVIVPLQTVTPTGPLPSDFFEIPSGAVRLTSTASGRAGPSSATSSTSSGGAGAVAPAAATGLGVAAAGAVAAAGLFFV